MDLFDYLVFIGRFQPFHNGHRDVVLHALKRTRKLIILVGSADTPRTTKNPFTFRERKEMIEATLDAEGVSVDRVKILPLHDHLYNENLWMAQVQRLVADVVGLPFECHPCSGTGWAQTKEAEGEKCFWCQGEGKRRPSVGIIGQKKDGSSYYLDSFPQWPLCDVLHTESLSATDLRNAYFNADNEEGANILLKANLPHQVFAALSAFKYAGPAYNQLVKEQKHLHAYKKAWEVAPYPPTFVTTDAVVTHSGHVLLVRRRSEPGKGLWAIPGGFLNPKEHLFDGCIRELREETLLKIPEKVMRGSLKAAQVFDHPDRSQRGRTITHAFHFDFPLGGELPKVKGSDDAEKARWFPIADALAMGPQLFEDHLHILEFFLHRG